VAYDAAGDVTNDGTSAFTYDAENRMTSATNSSRGLTCSIYNASGQRVRKTFSTVGTCAAPTSSTPNDYIYDIGGHIVGIPGSRNELYVGNRHLGTYVFSTTYFVHSDWLGTERARSSATGAPYETATSLPFGDALTSAGGSDPSPLHFTGLQRDSESNLDHTLFRQYSSSLGRWMHPDPAGLAAVDPANPQSWNRYSYVGNNPCSRIDPLGLDQCNLGVLARNTAGLNQNQITQIQNQIQSIFGQTTDGHGNTVGVAFNPSGRADATLTFENSAWYKIGSWGGSLGSTLCWPSLGCSGSSVYVDRVQQSYPGSAFALGTVAAHELFHQTTNTGHLDDPTNLMSANPTTPVPGTNLTQAQVAQLFKECRKLHPATSRGGGGGAGGGRSQLLDSGASCNTVDLPGYLGGSGSLCSDSSWCGIMGCGTGEGGGSASIDEIIF
jgi:RHS repeat-associated protein